MPSLVVPLTSPVLEALSAKALPRHLDAKDYAARILEDHVKDSLRQEDEQDLVLARKLIDQGIDTALRRVEGERFSSSITFDTIQELSADPTWLADYKKLVRDEPYKTGNPHKQTINQNLGYYIKKALGARSVTRADGKPANVKVQGSIIQSYTPLER